MLRSMLRYAQNGSDLLLLEIGKRREEKSDAYDGNDVAAEMVSSSSSFSENNENLNPWNYGAEISPSNRAFDSASSSPSPSLRDPERRRHGTKSRLARTRFYSYQSDVEDDDEGLDREEDCVDHDEDNEGESMEECIGPDENSANMDGSILHLSWRYFQLDSKWTNLVISESTGFIIEQAEAAAQLLEEKERESLGDDSLSDSRREKKFIANQIISKKIAPKQGSRRLSFIYSLLRFKSTSKKTFSSI